MPDESDTETEIFDLRKHVAVVRRHGVLIGVTMLVALVAAMALSFTRERIYRADTEVLLQARPSEDVLNGTQQQNPQYLQQLVQTEIEVMRSRSVEDAVAKALGRAPHVSIAAKGQTQVVIISAEDTDKARAVTEADTYARVYVDTRRKAIIGDLDDASAKLTDELTALQARVAAAQAALDTAEAKLAAATDADRSVLTTARDQARVALDQETAAVAGRRAALSDQIDQLQTTATLTRSRGAQVVSAARTPTQPVSPNPKRDAALALFLGLLVGLGLAFLREYLDDSIRTKDGLDLATGGLPTLALVPGVENWRDEDEARLELITHPNSPAAEAYRGLRTSLHFIGVERELKLIQVTSSQASEGKSTTSANLAVALARAGKRVVLVDCDLRRPRVHRFFGLSNAVGFTSWLLRSVPPAEALIPIEAVPGLSVMPSGPPPPNPSELLGTRTARDAFRALAELVDYVVIDSTPVLPVADSVVLAGYVDAVVVVAKAGSTTRRSLGRCLEMLRLADAPIAGVVLNRVRGENAYGYGYGYLPDEEPEPLGETDARADAGARAATEVGVGPG